VILYNKDWQSGGWAQILAAQELSRLRTRKKEAAILAKSAAEFFSSRDVQDPGLQKLIAELRKFEGG
jgi:hypothetical protein